MTNPLSWPIAYLSFLQGLFLAILALRILTMEEAGTPVLPWRWLALASIAQGLEQWLGPVTYAAGPGPALTVAHLVLLAVWVSFLAHFAGRWRRIPFGPLFGLSILAAAAAGPLAGKLAAGLLAAAAGVWAGVATLSAARSKRGPAGFALGLEGAAVGLTGLLAAAAIWIYPPGLPGVPALVLAAGQTVLAALMAVAFYGYVAAIGKARHPLWTWAVLAGILALGLGLTRYAGLDARRNLAVQGSVKAHALAGLVEGTINETHDAARSLAGSPVLRKALEQPASAAAAAGTLENSRQVFLDAACYLVSARGTVVASTSSTGRNYSAGPCFEEAMAGRTGGYFSGREKTYYAGAPVYAKSGSVIGAVVVEKDLGDMEPQWKSSYPESFLVDPSGTLILSSRPRLDSQVLRAAGAAPDQPADNSLVRVDGGPYLVSRRVINDAGWSVVVLNPATPLVDEKLAAVLLTLLLVLGDTGLRLATEKAVLRKEEAASSAAGYHTIFNAMDYGILVLDDTTGAVQEVNRKAREMFGGPDLYRLHFGDLAADESGHAEMQGALEQAAAGRTLLFEMLARSGDGCTFWTEVTLEPTVLGGRSCLLAVARDISERRKVQSALQTSEATYRAIFEETGLALVIVEDGGTISLISPAFARQTGHSRKDVEGKRNLTQLVHSDDQAKINQYFRLRRTFPAGVPPNFEIRITDRRNRTRTFLMTATFITGTDRSVVALVDITTRKTMEERLRDLSLHDPLTRLYNRAYFEKEIRRLGRSSTRSLGIIVCDVDGLKLINDTFGHQTGDEQLLAATEVIRRSFDYGGTIARIGGDEFVVLLPGAGRPAVEEAADRLRKEVAAYNEGGPPVPLSLSLGWAAGPPAGRGTDLFGEADNNMYREKLFSSQSGRSAIVMALVQTLAARDIVTAAHSDHLQELATAVGRELKLPENRITALRLLAQFHDIGKVGIPDHILGKPGPLTPEETTEMRRHTQIGHRIAQATPDLTPIADLIVKHHEWWNGGGYPFGLAGQAIPLESRIIAIVDAYDAMTSDRPYRAALSADEAAAEITRCAGTQFDPALVPVFLRILADRNGQEPDVSSGSD